MSKKPAASKRPVSRPEDGAAPAFGAGDDLEALRESWRMLAALLGNVPGMVYRCRNDAHRTMEFVSEGCAALTGHPPSDLLGNAVRAYADVVHPDDRERVRNEVAAAIGERRAFDIEYRIRTRTGEEKRVWERGQARMSRAGELLGLEGFITDITERVQTEMRLRDSEARFRALTTLSSHWYWEMDADFRFTRLEGRYVERDSVFFELIGKRPWNAGIESEGGGYAYRALHEAHEPLSYAAVQKRLANGTQVYMEISGEPVFDADGRFAGYRGVGRDVTRRRRAELATQRLARMYAALSATGEANVRARSPEELYRRVCEAAVDGGRFISAALIVVEPESSWMKVAAAAGVGEAQLRAARISTDPALHEGRGLVGEAVRAGRPAISDDYLNDERTRPCHESGRAGAIIRAAAAIPLLRGGTPAGALLLLADEKDAFDEEIVRLLERMGENVRFALESFEREAERRRAEQRLRESEERFRGLTNLLSDFYWETDAEHRFVMHSISGKPSTVFPSGTHIGKRRWELPYLSPDADGWRAHRALLEQHAAFHDFRYSRAAPAGDERHFSISGEPIFAADGGFAGYRGIGRDITERVRAEAELRKLSGAIEQTADIVMITDRDGVIEYVNAAFERTTGYTETEALGRRPSLLRSGAHDASFYARLWKTVLAGETFSEVFVNRKKSGEPYHEERTISPLRDADGRITHFIATGKDISERMQAQERLQHIAHHDALTGLPNRVLFLDRLEQALMRAHWQERMLGLMFLDLDRFKNVNDTLGHDTGDALLKAMAGRLRGCVREGDSVARLGGDEFAVLVEEVTHAEAVSVVARKILGAFARPFAIQPHELFVTASIGVAMYPNDGKDAATLLKNADAAMYRAKDQGKNNFQFYSADMSAAAFERLRLESSLRRALERGEFVLHYQPQVDLAQGRPIGVEALLRWQHPEFGLLAPTQFIAIAEETGAIVPIGEWVAREAMTQVRRWHAAGLPQLRIAINVSGRQFNEPGFVETVARLLEETGLAPAALELEITESVLMKNVGKTAERLRALHAMGVRFAIDDFGTGYSSLNYLRRFAIHTLKIDRGFVRDISKSGGDIEIVKTIITMARGLNLTVVAEGVETREQLTFLRSHGCHAVQGYLLARPLAADAVSERLRHAGSWLP